MTSSRPTFAVVIPTYQSADLVGEAVASALGQTYTPAQVIVSDDGSTDDVAAALSPYGASVTLIRNDHRGPSAAKNAALLLVAGDFVVFLDSDDVMLPERLEALAELASRDRELDILATDALIEREGTVIARFYEANEFHENDQRTAILESCFLLQNSAVRRDLVGSIEGFDESLPIAGDWDFWIRAILAGARAGLVPKPLVRYRRRAGAVTSDRSRTLWARVRVLERIAARQQLSREERQVLTGSLASHRRRARLHDAVEALAAGRSPRRELVVVALGRGSSLRTRVAAAAAATFPRLARRRLRSGERLGVEAGVRGDHGLDSEELLRS